MANIEGSASTTYRRHAVIFDFEGAHRSAAPQPRCDDTSEPESEGRLASDRGARSNPLGGGAHTSPPPIYVGSVSMGTGGWCSSLQPSSGSSMDSWAHFAVAEFDHDHGTSPARTAGYSDTGTPCDQHCVPSPSKLQSAYMRRLSRSRLFADGLGGIGLVFKAEKSQHVVCGIIPGGVCSRGLYAAHWLTIICRPYSEPTRQAPLTSMATCRWATSSCRSTGIPCRARASAFSGTA